MAESARAVDSLALAGALARAAEVKLASEVAVLDMRDLVSYTDYLVICSARNERQAAAIVEEVRELRHRRSIGLFVVVRAGGAVDDDVVPEVMHLGEMPQQIGEIPVAAGRHRCREIVSPPERGQTWEFDTAWRRVDGRWQVFETEWRERF